MACDEEQTAVPESPETSTSMQFLVSLLKLLGQKTSCDQMDTRKKILNRKWMLVLLCYAYVLFGTSLLVYNHLLSESILGTCLSDVYYILHSLMTSYVSTYFAFRSKQIWGLFRTISELPNYETHPVGKYRKIAEAATIALFIGFFFYRFAFIWYSVCSMEKEIVHRLCESYFFGLDPSEMSFKRQKAFLILVLCCICFEESLILPFQGFFALLLCCLSSKATCLSQAFSRNEVTFEELSHRCADLLTLTTNLDSFLNLQYAAWLVLWMSFPVMNVSLYFMHAEEYNIEYFLWIFSDFSMPIFFSIFVSISFSRIRNINDCFVKVSHGMMSSPYEKTQMRGYQLWCIMLSAPFRMTFLKCQAIDKSFIFGIYFALVTYLVFVLQEKGFNHRFFSPNYA